MSDMKGNAKIEYIRLDQALGIVNDAEFDISVEIDPEDPESVQKAAQEIYNAIREDVTDKMNSLADRITMYFNIVTGESYSRGGEA